MRLRQGKPNPGVGKIGIRSFLVLLAINCVVFIAKLGKPYSAIVNIEYTEQKSFDSPTINGTATMRASSPLRAFDVAAIGHSNATATSASSDVTKNLTDTEQKSFDSPTINGTATMRASSPLRAFDVAAIGHSNATPTSASSDVTKNLTVSGTGSNLVSSNTSRMSLNALLDELDNLSGGPQAKNLECTPPLVAFQNVIVRSDDDNPKSKNDINKTIPKIMHFSHKSRCLPQDLAAIIGEWKRTLPDYSIFFHDDNAVNKLLEEDWPEFPELHRAMKCVHVNGAMTVDVWRILLIYKYGGIYSDMDVSPLRKFTSKTIRRDLSAFFFTDPYSRPSQWFIAAEQGHPIMYLTMFAIVKNLLDLDHVFRPKVVFVTGPHAMKAGWDQFVTSGPLEGNFSRYENNYEYEGADGKKVLKTHPSRVVAVKRGYKDIVTLYNSTENVTREERISHESGVEHWRVVWGKLSSEHKGAKVSCRDYLKTLDDGSEEVPTRF